MKINKQQLKSLIKECLVEILAEGLGSTQVQEAVQRSAVKQQARPQVRRGVDFTTFNDPKSRQQQASALQEAIKKQSGGNSVMADILADTAATTLQTQIASEGRQIPAGDAISRVVSESTPEELFGEDTMSKWADLAFASPSPARTSF
jgi:hypothetical protein